MINLGRVKSPHKKKLKTMKNERIEISYILANILNSTKIDENGFITSDVILTAEDLEEMKTYIIKTKDETNIHSDYLNETIQKTNNILHLWPYKNE